MPFLDSLDIANRACQHCGVEQIFSVSEDSARNFEISSAYDKVRRAELRRNVWRFAIRKSVLRALDAKTLLLVPATYSASKTYLLGEIVQDTNGLYWMSEIADNINNAPGGNNEAWEMYFGPKTANVWDSGTSYYSGELVYVITGTTPNGYQVYMSLTNANEDTPGTGTAWDATVQYRQDEVVASGGFQWRSLLPVNLNNTPADGPLAWAAATAYTIAQTVTGSDNYIYSAIGSTTGNDPTTDAGVHWTNTGVLNAWSKTPTLLTSAQSWRPIVATLKNPSTLYPVGAGPVTQANTRNVFRLPAGFLREAPQSPKAGALTPLGGPGGLQYSDWEYEGDYIVSSYSDPIVFRFVADVTKVSAMDDMFCEGFAARIATAVVSKLTQSDGKLQTIASAYKMFMGEARTVNGIEVGSVEPPEDSYISVRD